MHPTHAHGKRSPMMGTRSVDHAKFPRAAIALLVLCGVIELVRSHFQFLWGDELGFGLLYLLRSGSFAHFVHLQLTRPVSFDPIGYNALVFAVVRLLGTSVFAMRLPDNCGYLGMQLCVFFLVRRIAGTRAATAALAIPAVLELSKYGIEARPYGVLLGVSALAALSWQTAARNRPRRVVALVVLACSLAFAVNLQYFAVLLFVPICAAEAVRSWRRGRVDVGMLVSIAAGMAGILLVIPFAHALLPFRANHLNIVEFDYRFITHSYLWLAAWYVAIDRTVRLLALAFILLLLALIFFFFRRRSYRALELPAEEAVLILFFCAFPVLAFLLAKFVTHWVDPRYTQPTIIGLAPLLAILLTPVLRSATATKIVFALLFISVSISGVWHIISGAQQRRARLDVLAGSAQARAFLAAHPGQPILTADQTTYSLMRYYDPPDIGSRVTFVVSPEQVTLPGVASDVSAQMQNMLADHVIDVVPYSAVSQHGMDQIFLLYHRSWDWTDQLLQESHAEIKPVCTMADGDLTVVHFP